MVIDWLFQSDLFAKLPITVILLNEANRVSDARSWLCDFISGSLYFPPLRCVPAGTALESLYMTHNDESQGVRIYDSDPPQADVPSETGGVKVYDLPENRRSQPNLMAIAITVILILSLAALAFYVFNMM